MLISCGMLTAFGAFFRTGHLPRLTWRLTRTQPASLRAEPVGPLNLIVGRVHEDLSKKAMAALGARTILERNRKFMPITRLKKSLWVSLPLVALLASAAIAGAQSVSDPRVADLVQAGRVRVGLGLGTPTVATKDPGTGEVRGPALDLARALASRIGIELVPVEYPRPGAVMEGVRAGAWDLAFLAIDPSRAAEADFSPPYMEVDLSYLVPPGSSIRNVADVDQPGVRIAVPRGDVTDL